MRAIGKRIPLALVIIVLWAWARPAGGAVGSTEVSDEQLALGEKVYVTHCKSCHLERGKSRIKRLNLSDDNWMHGAELTAIKKTIAEGVAASQMQPFGKKLSGEELEAVALYVQSLSAPPAGD